MKRLKKLEYKRVLADAFIVHPYLCGAKDGRIFVVMAHNFNDMKEFITNIELHVGYANMKCTRVHEDTPMEELQEWHSYIANKKGNPKNYPFWYRGRIYELKR